MIIITLQHFINTFTMQVCSNYYGYFFQWGLFGSQDIIQNLNQNKCLIIVLKESKWARTRFFFGQVAGVWNFFDHIDPILYQFFCK